MSKKKKTATKKTSRRPPAMPDLIAVTVSVPSLEERLDTIQANALTISALADHINRASSAYDSSELSRAIQRAADNVRDELAWLLTELPERVLNTPAPTTDMREAAERAAEGR